MSSVVPDDGDIHDQYNQLSDPDEGNIYDQCNQLIELGDGDIYNQPSDPGDGDIYVQPPLPPLSHGTALPQDLLCSQHHTPDFERKTVIH